MAASWLHDWGDLTKAQLDAQSAPDLNAELAAAKSAASTLIGSGAFGSTTAVYRIVARQDATAPSGYTVEIRGPIV